MIGIKKLALILTAVLAVIFMSGCAGSGEEKKESELLIVRQAQTGKIITIGDSKKDVEKITGPDEETVTEFLEDGVERWSYWDAPGLNVDYLNEVVVALWITGESDFELMNGVTFGMDEDAVKKLYQDHPFIEYGNKGGILTAYDKNLEPAEYNEETAAYLVRISFEEGVAEIINIQSNF